MGRIHDALKKAEEERRKKRAAKERGESAIDAAPQSPSSTAASEELPAAVKKTRIAEVAAIPEAVEQKKARRKGIAAGLQRAKETQPSSRSHSSLGELLLAWHAPTDQRSEQIRALRTNIVNLDPDPVVMAFVSSVGEEGAGMTAANLAVSFAEDRSQKILLVDGNLRHSTLASFFAVPTEAPGFKDVLEGKIEPSKAVVESGVPSLYFVNAGGRVDNPGALLTPKEINRCLTAWRRHFDRILIVTPPVSDANDAAVIGREVDGTVMVIKLGSTPRRETEHALEALAHSGVRVLGCVVTNASQLKDTARA